MVATVQRSLQQHDLARVVEIMLREADELRERGIRRVRNERLFGDTLSDFDLTDGRRRGCPLPGRVEFLRGADQFVEVVEAIFALLEASDGHAHVLEECHGSMAIAWMDERRPNVIYAARACSDLGRTDWREDFRPVPAAVRDGG